MGRIYAGIDEAGYGPMFGPLTIARAVFRLDGPAGEADRDPPSLWSVLRGGVCRKPTDKRRRVAVDDSKKLYTPARGIDLLERGVLSFLYTLNHQPTSVDELLEAVAIDDESRHSEMLWYAAADGGPALPLAHPSAQIALSAKALERSAVKQQVQLIDVNTAVVYEDRFNRIVDATRSKARCEWAFIGKHLDTIWREHGRERPFVVVDQQGGRQAYLNMIQLLFPEAKITRAWEEGKRLARYHLAAGERRMTVVFAVRADANHLPAALASMTAKYVREVLMERFNAYWCEQHPDIEPTRGYIPAARKFLHQIEPLIEQRRINRKLLVRSC